jgi:hypothetical protein
MNVQRGTKDLMRMIQMGINNSNDSDEDIIEIEADSNE